MIRFQSFLSGSSGNCTFITDGETNVLVDCGANGKYITECLRRIDIAPDTLDAVLVTHEHSDHVSGVGVISRKYGIPVIASDGTWEGMSGLIGKIGTSHIKIIKSGECFSIRGLEITPFSIPHDALEAQGFKFISGENSAAIATDLGHISDELIENLSGCDCVIVESNHDLDMLRSGKYPLFLKRRILSDRGHLSNEDCARLCVMLTRSGTKSIWLGHLSNENNRPALAYNTVREVLTADGIKVGSDVCLSVLPRYWIDGK